MFRILLNIFINMKNITRFVIIMLLCFFISNPLYAQFFHHLEAKDGLKVKLSFVLLNSGMSVNGVYSFFAKYARQNN